MKQKDLEEKFKLSCTKDNKQNKTFLKILADNYQNQIKEATNFYNYIVNKISIFYTNQFPNFVSIKHGGFDNIVKLLSKFDNNIEKASYIEQREEIIDRIEKENFKLEFRSRKDDEVKTWHKDENGQLVEFNLVEESLGTRTLFSMLGLLLRALEDGQILFFDDIEKSLHPVLVKNIIKMYKRKEYNTKQAQLFFTSHCTDIMNELRKTEIYIFKNTTKGGTTAQRLNKLNGVRNVTDFQKQYLNGEYGGIPYCIL